MTSEQPSGKWPVPEWCYGKLDFFIAGETSYICIDCGWIGWPRQEVEEHTGRILNTYPHKPYMPT